MSNVLLIALSTPQMKTSPYDLEELESLAKQIGLNPIQKITQHLRKPSAATAIGKGKVEELKEIIEEEKITMIIFFNELSNTQMRNLEFTLKIEVIDRTLLILDLLSQRAHSNLAKRLISITQMKYLLPRLSALNEMTDRQQGGIGLKGPGETQLELNRRLLEQSINNEEKALKKNQKVRAQNRKQRLQKGIKTVAIIGYTNAGKSTFMNRILKLSDPSKFVIEKDQVFSTLDTTSRRIQIKNNPPFILTDTVGFVSKMPTHLKKSFAATLEESVDADMILIIIDASSPYLEDHLKATNEMMEEVGISHKQKLYVLNKIDQLENPNDLLFLEHPYIKCSLKNDESIEPLLIKIKELLYEDYISRDYYIPYTEDKTRFLIKEHALIQTEIFKEKGVQLSAFIPLKLKDSLKIYET
jgi:GTP-binding protein HflX